MMALVSFRKFKKTNVTVAVILNVTQKLTELWCLCVGGVCVADFSRVNVRKLVCGRML